MKFDKPATSITEQIELLKRRGMAVGDEALAKHYLQFISYYRLRAYWSIFEVPATDGDHAFREGTTLDEVLTLYIFDRELRLLTLDAIERVEVALRAQWAHHMAIKYGPHGYLKQSIYRREEWHAKNTAVLTDEFERSHDIFAEHYRKKYTNPKLPPIWMAAEAISFGLLSKWINSLRSADKKAIAKPFATSEIGLASICHHLIYIRNICAHHGRLWNKRFTINMSVKKLPPSLQDEVQGADNRRLHNTLVVLGYLPSVIAPETQWRKRVIGLIDRNDPKLPTGMGFPADWRERAVWK